MEQTLGEALQESPDRFLELVAARGARGCKALLLKVLAKCSKNVVAGLCDGLFQHVSGLFKSFETWVEDSNLRASHFAVLKACALVIQAAIATTSEAFEPGELYPTVLLLHDGLVSLEEDPDLQEIVASLCETWWRNDYGEKETLVAQSLPFLLAKSFQSRRKSDVRRVYALRDALSLFDFSDKSTEDLKHLLIRCVLTGTYLRTAEGCRIISLLFGLDAQLGKELFTIVRSEIPSSSKSILATFGKVLYRAWKDSEEACRQQIEDNCIQRLIEGAIYASTKELATSVRTVLNAFFEQKTQVGVEAMLFRLHEPVLFRSLQVANSDVRRNALLLLIEVFPLQDPEAPKEEMEAVSEKQFLLFEKTLFDPCPDLRCTAIEGVSRILRDFWETLPSQQIVKFLTALVDDMSKDETSTVRLSVITSLTYLLENPQSHGLLQAFLPRLGLMLNDSALNVRIAVADMLLAIKESPSLHFSKVAKMDFLLSCLASDNSLIARRLTRLLISSFLPSKLSPIEACHCCVKWIRRSPGAGSNFCRWALEEGVSRELLLDLVKALSRTDVHMGTDTGDDMEGVIACLLEVCCALAAEKHGREGLGEILSMDVLTSLMNRVSTPQERSSILRVASLLPPKDAPELFAYCGKIVFSSKASCSPDLVQEIKAVHSLVLAWGGFNDLINALIKPLKHVIDLLPRDETSAEGQLGTLHESGNGAQQGKKRRKSAWVKVLARSGKECKDSPTCRLEESAENSLVAAAGAAWQIQNLLAEEGTRNALLSSEVVIELQSHLREVVRRAVYRTQCVQVWGNMEISPFVLAYVKLSMHCAIQEGLGTGQRTECKASTRRRGQKASSKSSAAPPLGKKIAELLGELLRLASNVQDAPLPEARLPRSSPPPVQPRAKCARNSNSKQRRRESPQPASFQAAEETVIDVLTARASIIAVTLQSILEALSLKLVTETSVRESCAIFAKKAIDWTRDGLVILLETSVGDASTGAKHKDFLTYAKVNASYGAKMVYLMLRHGSELWHVTSALAHSLLDLLAVSDSLVGGASAIGTGVRPWLPDVLIAVTTLLSSPLDSSQDAENDPAVSRHQNLLASFYGNETLRPWVGHCAKSGFLQMALQNELLDRAADAVQSIGDGDPSSPKGLADKSDGRSSDSHEDNGATVSPPSGAFVETVVKLLRKGNSLVPLEFVGKLVECTAFLFAKQEYSHAVGLVDVICRRILGCRRPEKGLNLTLQKATLEELQRLQEQVNVVLTSEAEGGHISEQYWQFQTAEKLLRLVITSYNPASAQDCVH